MQWDYPKEEMRCMNSVIIESYLDLHVKITCRLLPWIDMGMEKVTSAKNPACYVEFIEKEITQILKSCNYCNMGH